MQSLTTLRIGTRRSALALWQTHFVRDALRTLYPSLAVELVHMTTTGDRVIDRPLPEIGGKGVFTQELEDALRTGAIDLAVHSLKDLPTEIDPAFTLGAIPPRAAPFDALVTRGGHTLATLPDGATVGTSSLRRRAQLLAARPDLRTQDLRGNVDTRLRKAADPAGPYDAIVLAVAGLERLGRADAISDVLDTDEIMLPAPGQGAIVVQCRADDDRTRNLLAMLDHRETRLAVAAERAFLAGLEAGCRLPVSAYATLADGEIRMVGRVSDLDGVQPMTVRGTAAEDDAEALGVRLAAEALSLGAAALLDAVKKGLPG